MFKDQIVNHWIQILNSNHKINQVQKINPKLKQIEKIFLINNISLQIKLLKKLFNQSRNYKGLEIWKKILC